MSILNNLLSFLFDLLAGLILIFGLIAVFCILLSSIRITPDETKVVTKFSKAGTMIECWNLVTKSNEIQVDTEFDKADLLEKLSREIAPDCNGVDTRSLLWLSLLWLLIRS